MIETVILIFIFVAGLCVGSFLNVVALRALSGESIVFPASHCTKCKKQLHWQHNLPVISYIFLGGKCSFCKEKISIQYPVVEFSTASLFTLIVLNFGLTIDSLLWCVLIAFMMLILITDFKEQVVFDWHTYPIIVFGLIYSLINHQFVESIFGIALGFIFFEAFARLGYLFAKTRAFGEGDTIIAMGLGAYFGWKNLLMIIILSILIQVIVALPVLIHKAYKNKDHQTFFAYLIMVLCIFLTRIANHFALNQTFGGAVAILCIITVLLLYSAIVIFKNLKNAKTHTYMPFGPALVFAAIIMLFYMAFTDI